MGEKLPRTRAVSFSLVKCFEELGVGASSSCSSMGLRHAPVFPPTLFFFFFRKETWVQRLDGGLEVFQQVPAVANHGTSVANQWSI